MSIISRRVHSTRGLTLEFCFGSFSEDEKKSASSSRSSGTSLRTGAKFVRGQFVQVIGSPCAGQPPRWRFLRRRGGVGVARSALSVRIRVATSKGRAMRPGEGVEQPDVWCKRADKSRQGVVPC
eukprot:scaffold26670_cov64-Phaeocystis_antarctica.AAC.1